MNPNLSSWTLDIGWLHKRNCPLRLHSLHYRTPIWLTAVPSLRTRSLILQGCFLRHRRQTGATTITPGTHNNASTRPDWPPSTVHIGRDTHVSWANVCNCNARKGKKGLSCVRRLADRWHLRCLDAHVLQRCTSVQQRDDTSQQR